MRIRFGMVLSVPAAALLLGCAQTDKEFDPMEFRSPSSGYRPAPFWSWNDELADDELRRQIGEMDEQGMGGFFTTPEVQEDPIGITLLYPRGYTSGLSLSLAKNPVLWSLGLFAAGWAGGYFTWVAIGRGR